MSTCIDRFGHRVRKNITIFISRWPGDFTPHTVDNLVQAANVIGPRTQLLKLPEAMQGIDAGIIDLHPLLFDWLKVLLPGAPWDRTAVVTIGEPSLPQSLDDDDYN